MFNNVTIQGRLPKWSTDNYNPPREENGKTSSAFISWQLSVSLGKKIVDANGKEHWDEALVNFTAYGKDAEELKAISDNIKNLESQYIIITGKLIPAYRDQNNNLIYGKVYNKKDNYNNVIGTDISSACSISATDVVFVQKKTKNTNGNGAVNNASVVDNSAFSSQTPQSTPQNTNANRINPLGNKMSPPPPKGAGIGIRANGLGKKLGINGNN